MPTRSVPLATAVASIDRWADAITRHADAGQVAQLGLAMKRAMQSVEAIGDAPLGPELRRAYLASTLNLLDTMHPLIGRNDEPAWSRAAATVRAALSGDPAGAYARAMLASRAPSSAAAGPPASAGRPEAPAQ